jgi:hypothetical protein
VAVALLLSSSADGNAQAVLYGVVRDASSDRPVAEVLVQVEGVPRDTTGGDGAYRVVLAGHGDYVVHFGRVGYAALLAGMRYVVSGDEASDSLRLDVAWPGVSDLARTVCSAHASDGILVGRVRTDPVPTGTEVVAGWDDHVPDPRRRPETVSFGGFGVSVSPDGSFVLCALPRDREVRLYARVGHMSGAITRLRLPGRAVREVQLEPPGRDD